ncbi:MAG TPA: HAD-IIIA family hydrolase [Actinomycetota bacterium]|nr:HAD-IIIA family hydrolase [Actinomycetota bacterium]
MARPAVFLDRDGVLNEVCFHGGVASTPRSAEDLVIDQSTAYQLGRLRESGFALIVVSNQPDVARGGLLPQDLAAINEALREALPVDAIYVCPHDRSDGCGCRKPKPGLIHQAAAEWGIDLSRSWLIGDRWVDLAAAEAAGVAGVLLECAWSWAPTSEGAPPRGLAPVFSDVRLAGCITQILDSS